MGYGMNQSTGNAKPWKSILDKERSNCGPFEAVLNMSYLARSPRD